LAYDIYTFDQTKLVDFLPKIGEYSEIASLESSIKTATYGVTDDVSNFASDPYMAMMIRANNYQLEALTTSQFNDPITDGTEELQFAVVTCIENSLIDCNDQVYDYLFNFDLIYINIQQHKDYFIPEGFKIRYIDDNLVVLEQELE